jgi:hypothetical protein
MGLKELFEKKVTIYKKKDRETWEQIRNALKNAGLKGVRAAHYSNDVVQAGGCAAKLDPRDFGGHGKIDHDIYFIEVRESDRQKALDIIKEAGLVTIVDPNASIDRAVLVTEEQEKEKKEAGTD